MILIITSIIYFLNRGIAKNRAKLKKNIIEFVSKYGTCKNKEYKITNSILNKKNFLRFYKKKKKLTFYVYLQETKKV